jgi:signal transduction histidine kinase/DNA-binding response OmpR family regulator
MERATAALVTIGGLAVLALVLILSLQRRRGVARLVQIAHRLARGDFVVTIPAERGVLAPLTASLRVMAAALRERDRQAETLLAVSRVGGNDLATLLADVRRALEPVLDVALISLIAVEPAQLKPLALWPPDLVPERDQPLPRAGSACALALERGEPLVVDDVSRDDFPENATARQLGRPGYVILPLRGASPRALAIVVKAAATLGSEARRFLTILGQQLSGTVANTLLSRELTARDGELERANRARSDFLAMMSHELRTPLNAIIDLSNGLGDGKLGGLDAGQAQKVRNIGDSGRHLLRLIDDLLDMSRIDAGRLEILPERCDVPPLVVDVLAQLQPMADAKQISLHFSGVAAVPPVWADRLRVKQVLFNLLANAINFTRAGERLDVALEPMPGQHELRVSVNDSGPGMAEEEQRELFLPFSQLANARNQPHAGTGLGLALVKQLVELMDGRVGVSSAVGLGSRFTVDLRLMPPATTTPGDVPADAPLVLVVDGDAAARELMELTLATARLRSLAVATGQAALAEARARQPAAILLDVFLPDRDGWEVLRALRADQATAHIPVVLVRLSSDRQRAITLDAIDHLVKPIATDALMTTLGRHGFATKVKQREVRVLVVDDDARHCERMRAALEPRGFVVRPALTGEAGLMIAATEPIDLVLLDLVLPDLSGVDVAVALRQDDRTRKVPIVLVTAQQLAPRERARLNGSVAAMLAKAETGPSALLVEVKRALAE